jgi:hypothetical protein
MPITSTTSPSTGGAAPPPGAAAPPPPSPRRRQRTGREAPGQAAPRVVVERDVHRGRPRRLRPPRPRQRHQPGRQRAQPGQHDLRRRDAALGGQRGQHRIAGQRRRAQGAAQRGVGQHRDAAARAQLDDAAAQRRVVARTDRDLDRGDRQQRQRLLELPAIDVADADGEGRAAVDDGGHGAQAGRQRHPRIGRVQEPDVRRPAERGGAGLGVGAQGASAAVGSPAAALARHAALGDDADAGAQPGIRRGERACDQPLVVAEVVLAAAVGARGVEQRDAGVERRGEGRQRPVVVAVGVGREAHAAEPEHDVAGDVAPGVAGAVGEGLRAGHRRDARTAPRRVL